ncbi:Uncharacterized protein SCF082_LOCUS17713 [Durusdinium trenchii]|uniref:Uncharacterized protein n=1 Tax=Durusdinium trenchii TaxID=1381693 RepID=A0ABP0KJB0_9DINO
MALLSLFSHLQCWACCGDMEDEAPDLQVPGQLLPKKMSFARGHRSTWAMDERIETKPSARRQELKETMKLFATRGMQGVPVQLFDESSGSLHAGTYQIDDRLRSIHILPEDTADSSAYSRPSHTVMFSQILDVGTGKEVMSHVEPGAWTELSPLERDRLLVLVYNIETPESLSAVDCRKVFFLETDTESSKIFALCVRILRHYIEDIKQPELRSI